jgi:hypothetical protein
VPLHVVEEDTLALHETLVLLARHVLARVAGFRLLLLDDDRLGDVGLAQSTPS